MSNFSQFGSLCIFFSLSLSLLQYWSSELARIARERACQCTYNPHGTVYPYRDSYAVENLGLYFGSDITEIVYSWFREGRNHEYSSVGCYHPPKHSYSDYSCEHYIQV